MSQKGQNRKSRSTLPSSALPRERTSLCALELRFMASGLFYTAEYGAASNWRRHQVFCAFNNRGIFRFGGPNFPGGHRSWT